MIPAGYRKINSEHVPGKTKLFEFIYGLRRYTFSVTNQAALLLERYMPNKLLLIFETIFCYLHRIYFTFDNFLNILSSLF